MKLDDQTDYEQMNDSKSQVYKAVFIVSCWSGYITGRRGHRVGGEGGGGNSFALANLKSLWWLFR